MSISSRLSNREFASMPPFISALDAGVNDELIPIRRELVRLNSELQAVRAIAETALQTANSAQNDARQALALISSLQVSG
jgi:hypothetical protein